MSKDHVEACTQDCPREIYSWREGVKKFKKEYLWRFCWGSTLGRRFWYLPLGSDTKQGFSDKTEGRFQIRVKTNTKHTPKTLLSWDSLLGTSTKQWFSDKAGGHVQIPIHITSKHTPRFMSSWDWFLEAYIINWLQGVSTMIWFPEKPFLDSPAEKEVTSRMLPQLGK